MYSIAMQWQIGLYNNSKIKILSLLITTYTGLAVEAPGRGTLTSESEDELSDSESEPLKNLDIFL